MIAINENGDYGTENKQVRPTSKIYKRRYLILLLYCLYNFSLMFQWSQFTVIPIIVTKYYGASSTVINWTFNMAYIFYVPGTIFVTYMIKILGVKNMVVFASFFVSLGTSIKCFGTNGDSFYIAFIGQTCVALSPALTINLISKIPHLWFPRNEISKAIACCVIATLVGQSAGLGLTPLIVRDSEEPSKITTGFKNLFIGQAIFSFLNFIAIVIFFEEKPPLPPSIAQAVTQQIQAEESYIKSLWKTVKNVNCLLIAITFGLTSSINDSIAANSGSMFDKQFPEHKEFSGFIGLVVYSCGMVGAFTFGAILDKTKRFKMVTYICLICALASLSSLLIFNNLHILYVVLAIFGCVGFFSTASTAISYDFSAEAVYPESEAVAAGIINIANGVFGLIMSSMTSFILQTYGVSYTYVLFMTVMTISLFFSFFTRNVSMENPTESLLIAGPNV